MSRLALTVYQGLAGDHNARALDGARAVGEALAGRLGLEPAVAGDPAPVLSARWDLELEAARPGLHAMSTILHATFVGRARPVSALTRCAVALATLPVVVRHHPDVCVVWFDAHADLNTPDTSPSGYLGGMVLAGAAGLWNSGLGAGLDLANVVMVGARDVDPPEQALMQSSGLQHVAVQTDVSAALRAAVGGRPVYVHLDCDVLEPGLVPTDYAVGGGLTLAQLREAVDVLAESDVLGLEIAEFEGAWRHDAAAVSPAPVVAAVEPLLARLLAWEGGAS